MENNIDNQRPRRQRVRIPMQGQQQHRNNVSYRNYVLSRYKFNVNNLTSGRVQYIAPVKTIEGKSYGPYMSAIGRTMYSLQHVDKNNIYRHIMVIDHTMPSITHAEAAMSDKTGEIVLMAIYDSMSVDGGNVVNILKDELLKNCTKKESRTFTTEEIGRMMKVAALRMIYEASCNPFDCGDRDAQPWSSYREETPEQNNANTMGSVFKVTMHGEKKLANKTLREFNNGCKQSGFRFIADTSLIGGHYVDEATGDCYKWKPTTYGESKKRLRKITEAAVHAILSEAPVETPELINILGNAQQFAIISAEVEGMNEEEKAEANRKLTRMLRQLGCKTISQYGYWGGNPELSYSIIGLNDEQCAKISAGFKQEGYIIGRRDESSSCGYKFELYTCQNRDGNYSLSSESNTIATDGEGIENAGGYTEIEGFKYAIEF